MKRNGMFVPQTGTLADVVNRARAYGMTDVADAVLTGRMTVAGAADTLALAEGALIERAA